MALNYRKNASLKSIIQELVRKSAMAHNHYLTLDKEARDLSRGAAFCERRKFQAQSAFYRYEELRNTAVALAPHAKVRVSRVEDACCGKRTF